MTEKDPYFKADDTLAKLGEPIVDESIEFYLGKALPEQTEAELLDSASLEAEVKHHHPKIPKDLIDLDFEK